MVLLSTQLRPLLGADDIPVETEEEYASRIGHVIPNAPPEVLGQWFFDHWQQIEDWNRVDLQHVSFSRIRWETHTFLEDDLGDGEGVAQRSHYLRATKTDDLAPSYRRLLSYMSEHGTWPRPVIVFDTRSPFPWLPGWMRQGAHQLVEGHRRFAVLRTIAGSVRLHADHDLWLAVYTPAP